MSDMLDAYFYGLVAGQNYEMYMDIIAEQFRFLLSNSVASVVDYPIAEYDTIKGTIIITINTMNKYCKDLERDLDDISIIDSYYEDGGDNWTEYQIVLSKCKIIKGELEECK